MEGSLSGWADLQRESTVEPVKSLLSWGICSAGGNEFQERRTEVPLLPSEN
jgi:hypothetical protein